jgi:ribosomal protein L7/L12
MLGLGMNEIIVIGFLLFDMLVVGLIVVFVIAKRSGTASSDATRLGELERQVAQLKKDQSGLQNAASSPFGTASAFSNEGEIKDLIRQGRMIDAIKRYRELNPGVGLKEAQAAVEAMRGRM